MLVYAWCLCLFDDLILLTSNSQERLEDIEKDQREYTLDDDDKKIHEVILNPEPSTDEAMALKKSLSCSYPNMPFNKALQKENEKLQLELQRSQANLNVGECQVIQRLLDVTESVAATSLHEKNSPEKSHKVVENTHVDANHGHSSDESFYKNTDTRTTSRSANFCFHFSDNVLIIIHETKDLHGVTQNFKDTKSCFSVLYFFCFWELFLIIVLPTRFTA